MNNTVNGIMTILVMVAIYQFVIAKPKYRVRLTDPITSRFQYVLSIDGINDTYQYTASSKDALVLRELPRAEKMLAAMPDHTNAVIEVKRGFIPWKHLNPEA